MEDRDGTRPVGEETVGRDRTDPAAARRDVRETYDRIADHFAGTRTHAWPEVVEFVEREGSEQCDVGLDLGCGNGRHAAVLARRCDRVLALDASRPILEAATSDLSEPRWETDPGRIALVQGDATRLPLADGSVDLAVYVATLHHLPTRAARVASLEALERVLAPGGRGLVSVWSTAHDRFDREEGFDTTIDWTLPGGETVPRFYHVYDPEEFDRDLADSDLLVRRSRVSSGNCYAEVEGT
jgi:ubiquinone/menaquinone biosynthesis C-methylase UbiE